MPSESGLAHLIGWTTGRVEVPAAFVVNSAQRTHDILNVAKRLRDLMQSISDEALRSALAGEIGRLLDIAEANAQDVRAAARSGAARDH